MALINCNGCGKQISTKAIACPHCGWKLNDNIFKDKQNKIKAIIKNKNFKIVSSIIIVIITLKIIDFFLPAPTIVGAWNNEKKISGTGMYVLLEQYEFYNDWTATKNTNHYVSNNYVTSSEHKCTYKFRRFNTQIKISCDYEKKELKKEKNVWVDFKKDKDIIYINNKKYVNNWSE